jgi:outer membrane protein
LVTSFLSLYFLLTVAQVGGAPGGISAPLTGGVAAPPAAAAASPSAPATSGGPSAAGTTGVGASGTATSSSPGFAASPLSTVGQPISLTLDQVVNFAVGNNTNVILARQRLAEASEGIKQVDAFGRPQVTSTLADTYSTFTESAADFSTLVTNPTLPSGTNIPTVVDQAADFTTAFGLGGTSTATSTLGAGTISSFTGTSVTLPAAGATSLPAPLIGGSSSSTTLPGANTGTTGTGSGAGTTAPSSTGTAGSAPTTSSVSPTPGSTTSPGSGTTPGSAPIPSPDSSSAPLSTSGAAPSTSGTSFNLVPMPLILQNYVTEPAAPQVVVNVSAATDSSVENPQDKVAAATGDTAQDSNVAKSGPERIADQDTSTTGTTTAVSSALGQRAVNTYGAKVNLSQYIDAFGLLSAEKSAEKLTTNFYSIDIDRTENEVALSAKNLFFNVVLAQATVATEQEAVTDSQESVRVTQALVNQGQAAGFDLLSAQTTLANNQQLLSSAQDQYSFALADLDYLLGVSPSTQVSLIVPPLPPLNEAVDLQQSTQVALQRRPEVLQANQNILLAQKLVKVATAGTTPTIGLVGSYDYNNLSSETDPNNEGLVSAQVAFPIDDGGATRSRVREAKDVFQSQVTTRNELDLSVALEVRQAYLNILDGQTRATTAQTGVDLAVETLRVANVQYQNGVGTILDVENAQAQLATARTNLANAQFTYQTALASLVRAIGSR